MEGQEFFCGQIAAKNKYGVYERPRHFYIMTTRSFGKRSYYPMILDDSDKSSNQAKALCKASSLRPLPPDILEEITPAVLSGVEILTIRGALAEEEKKASLPRLSDLRVARSVGAARICGYAQFPRASDSGPFVGVLTKSRSTGKLGFRTVGGVGTDPEKSSMITEICADAD